MKIIVEPARAEARRIGAGSAAGFIALLTIASLLMVGTPAMAHDGHGTSDEKHAQEDLAGTPMSTIEQQTAQNAQAALADGTAPVNRTQAAIGAAVSTDAGVAGSWSAVVATEVLPVFQAVLPNGRVLMWDSVGDNATESYPNHTFTRAMVWNPVDNTHRRVDVQGYNIFCAGYVQLPDGNVLVAGGNKNAALDGIRQTHLFDWRTETWSRGPDMASERWYPSVAALASGEALIVAGGSGQAEVYQSDGSLRTLTGFASFADRAYPFLVPRNDGRVELVGPGTQLGTMDTTDTGALVSARARDGINRDYGSFATYLPGKTLVSGGGSITEDGQTQVPTRTAVIVDTTGAGTTVTSTSSMAFPRRQHNLTILADGSVLATGGQRKAIDLNVDLANPVLAAEIWSPSTAQWTTLSSAAKVREYHSTATLLPDGRVLTGGGGICGSCVANGYLEKNIEYFTPPYLFKNDGSGQLATRPVVTAVPASTVVGTRFTATSTSASAIRKIGLVRLGAPTHSVDQGQRYVPLTFTANGATLSIDAPTSANLAPPGYYMLFATDDQGVPSVASMIQITLPPAPPAPVNLALNKPATASSSEATQFAPAFGNDGKLGTRWSSNYSDNQWWQADLGSVQSIDKVVTSWEAAYARRFTVQTSVDGATFTTAATVDATGPATQRTTFTSRPARYVRIQGVTRGTAYGYSLFETQVFGDGTIPVNTIPIASAGADQSVVAGSTVTLDGSASSDAEGTALTYRWTQTAGAAVTLSNTTSVKPTFVAPAAAAALTFDLVVSDGSASSAVDSVAITTTAAPPAISNLALNKPASASSTEATQFGAALGNDGNSATRWSSNYSDNQWWQVDLGTVRSVDTVVTSWEAAYARRFAVQTSFNGTTFPPAAIVDATGPAIQRTTFASRGARYIRIQGITRGSVHGYSLYETQIFGDGTVPVNTAPVASAGADQSIVAGSTVTLDGSASSDAEGTALAYRWTQTAGTTVTLSSTTAMKPTFVSPTTAGTVTFDLVVSDGSATSIADSITVVTTAAPVVPVNLALNRPATASSTETPQFGPSFGNDGSATTRWSSNYSDNQWWQVDLGTVKSIDTVVTSWEAAYARRFAVQTSMDGVTFTTVQTVDASAAGTQRTTFIPRSARYVRIQGVARGTGYGYSLYETRVFGPVG